MKKKTQEPHKALHTHVNKKKSNFMSNPFTQTTNKKNHDS